MIGPLRLATENANAMIQPALGGSMEHAEATPLRGDDLLHLGDRAAVVRSLSRLVRSDRLPRIPRGVYMPVGAANP